MTLPAWWIAVGAAAMWTPVMLARCTAAERATVATDATKLEAPLQSGCAALGAVPGEAGVVFDLVCIGLEAATKIAAGLPQGTATITPVPSDAGASTLYRVRCRFSGVASDAGRD